MFQVLLAASLLGAVANAYGAPGVGLVPNGDFEKGNEAGDWPVGWAKPKEGGSWQTEGENRFIRLSSTSPGAMIMIYQEIPIPAEVKAIEVKWRHRITGLKKGTSDWFDARIMMEFLDGQRAKVSPGPKVPSFRKDVPEWTEASVQFLVSEGATMLKFMPALFQVESGVWDIDDMSISAVDPEPLRVEAAERAAKAAAAMEKRLAGKRAKASAALQQHGDLIVDGGYTKPPGKKAKNLVDEEGNRYLRLESKEPGKMVLDYREIDLPEGVEALSLGWKQRISDLKKGEKSWYDARILLEFKGADGKVMKGKPAAPYSQRNTEGWVERSTEFLVPKEAASVVIMPALFHVKAGRFELDDFSLKPVDPAVLVAKQKEREERVAKSKVPVEADDQTKWPPMLKVKGNRLVTVDGGKEVWLQGMNVASLEWSVRGEQVHKSIVVGLEQWKGNVIRLPIKEDYWFGKDMGDEGEAYREVVDQAVTLAANRGCYLVLDLHRYRAPKKEHLAFWADAAARYKDHPAVIFDLLNEPHGISWEVWRNGGFVEERKKEGDEDAFLSAEEKLHNKRGFESPGMQAMLDAVRATGAKNLVVVGGLDYAYQLDGIVDGFGLKDEEGNGIIYACHIYPWKKGWQKYLLDAAALHPILLGEVGADAKKMDFMPHEMQEDAETWVPDILGLIQEHRLNWTAWCFHPSASPRMLLNWDYEPTPVWGAPAKEAMSGKAFPMGKLR
ncbi:glycoside hydrolase family 5 protein [Phragmitibacter flavus]|uniref:Glycoside hydrolase family 5 protein n=1 Tax=Phragmitibacter flavus TaxID=2576071 RepID=A0A5R8KH23_9BACT|nr:cellulase family glycosylhydrolase [Phragmitibacter flavus]TLD71275.1 glycoside hydrolase family 5 protein [Phragmitibacter flavus]